MLQLNIGAAVGEIMKGLDGLFTSDEERSAATLEVTKTLQQPHILQALTNIEEAKHASIFVAGWRPAIGWTCAIGLFYHFLIYPFAGMIAHFAGLPGHLPPVDVSILSTMTLSLLGLGGLRTYEKLKGVSREDDPAAKRQLSTEGGLY